MWFLVLVVFGFLQVVLGDWSWRSIGSVTVWAPSSSYGGGLIVGTDSGVLALMDEQTGLVQWRRVHEADASVAQLLVHEINGQNYTICRIVTIKKTYLSVYETISSSLLYTYGSNVVDISVSGKGIIVVDADGSVSLLNYRTGGVYWKHKNLNAVLAVEIAATSDPKSNFVCSKPGNICVIRKHANQLTLSALDDSHHMQEGDFQLSESEISDIQLFGNFLALIENDSILRVIAISTGAVLLEKTLKTSHPKFHHSNSIFRNMVEFYGIVLVDDQAGTSTIYTLNEEWHVSNITAMGPLLSQRAGIEWRPSGLIFFENENLKDQWKVHVLTKTGGSQLKKLPCFNLPKIGDGIVQLVQGRSWNEDSVIRLIKTTSDGGIDASANSTLVFRREESLAEVIDSFHFVFPSVSGRSGSLLSFQTKLDPSGHCWFGEDLKGFPPPRDGAKGSSAGPYFFPQLSGEQKLVALNISEKKTSSAPASLNPDATKLFNMLRKLEEAQHPDQRHSWTHFVVFRTKKQSLFGVHTVTGTILWRTSLPGIVKSVCEVDGYIVVITERDGRRVLIHLDPISGNFIAETNLSEEQDVTHIASINGKDIAVIYDTLSGEIIGNSGERYSNLYDLTFYRHNKHSLKGYIPIPDGMKVQLELKWKMNFSLAGMEILTVAAPTNSKYAHVDYHVLGDATIKKRFNNHDAIVVIAKSSKALILNIVDTSDGLVLLATQLPPGASSKSPITVLFHENLVLVHYWDNHHSRFELLSIELFYDRPDPGPIKIIFQQHEVDEKSRTQLEWFTKTYIFPCNVRTLSATASMKGITPAAILVATTQDQVYYIPRSILSARRPKLYDQAGNVIATLTSAEKDEGLVPYEALLPLKKTHSLTKEDQIHYVRGISVAPTGLESTSIVCSYGIEVSCLVLHPAGLYDSLPSDFNRSLLITAMIVIVSLYLYTSRAAKVARLKHAWQ